MRRDAKMTELDHAGVGAADDDDFSAGVRQERLAATISSLSSRDGCWTMVWTAIIDGRLKTAPQDGRVCALGCPPQYRACGLRSLSPDVCRCATSAPRTALLRSFLVRRCPVRLLIGSREVRFSARHVRSLHYRTLAFTPLTLCNSANRRYVDCVFAPIKIVARFGLLVW